MAGIDQPVGRVAEPRYCPEPVHDLTLDREMTAVCGSFGDSFACCLWLTYAPRYVTVEDDGGSEAD